ncbi:MAG TPA: long-chain fatty acid--CoA ligase, partial [Candidatus Dormibacteraeota bacterium]|nr:long-chain fatty acid--CoA ligase [Candidatus Dormibacteraeota bacterium]
ADEEVVLAVEPQDGADRAELRRRVKREIFEGPRRIDIYARPDRIVFTRIPLAGRSHKPDKIALRKLVMELIRC